VLVFSKQLPRGDGVVVVEVVVPGGDEEAEGGRGEDEGGYGVAWGGEEFVLGWWCG